MTQLMLSGLLAMLIYQRVFPSLLIAGIGGLIGGAVVSAYLNYILSQISLWQVAGALLMGIPLAVQWYRRTH